MPMAKGLRDESALPIAKQWHHTISAKRTFLRGSEGGQLTRSSIGMATGEERELLVTPLRSTVRTAAKGDPTRPDVPLAGHP